MKNPNRRNSQRRILAANPYKLNRFGVLELPGLPAMPLAGLTASEATKRLAADPRAQRFLRAHDAAASGADGRRGAQAVRLRPVRGSSQHLRAGVRYPGAGRLHRGSRATPWSSSSTATSRQTYELTVERDGRINFPKLGPDHGQRHDVRCRARKPSKHDVSKQLIGTPRQRDHGRSALDPRVRARRGRKARLLHGERPVDHDQRTVRQRRRQEDRLACATSSSSATAVWSRRSICTIFCCAAIPAATVNCCRAMSSSFRPIGKTVAVYGVGAPSGDLRAQERKDGGAGDRSSPGGLQPDADAKPRSAGEDPALAAA